MSALAPYIDTEEHHGLLWNPPIYIREERRLPRAQSQTGLDVTQGQGFTATGQQEH